MILLTPTLNLSADMKVIEQDRYVRISFNQSNKFVRVELLEDFQRINIELLRDTFAILSDVIKEQRIEKLLLDFRSHDSTLREQFSGFELGTSILHFNERLEGLAILSSGEPDHRSSLAVTPSPKILVFAEEQDALEWAGFDSSSFAC